MNQITVAGAELLGLHVGDGSLYRTSRGLVWELRGNNDEKEFYDMHIVPLVREATGAAVIAKPRSGGKNGCYGIQSSNSPVVDFLVQAGFTPGRKSATVRTPGSVWNASLEVKAGYLRGLFATDGTAYLSRINGNESRTHPKIEFASISKVLRDEVQELLLDFGLESSVWTHTSKRGWKPAYFLRLSGVQKARLFHEHIGLLNPKHYSRLSAILDLRNL